MVRMLLLAAAVIMTATPALAAPCKDANTGKFIKCATAPAPKPTRCKAANGKFAKCGTPGAKPI